MPENPSPDLENIGNVIEAEIAQSTMSVCLQLLVVDIALRPCSSSPADPSMRNDVAYACLLLLGA